MRTSPALGLVVLLAACSSSGSSGTSAPKDPAVSSFTTGTCRDAAPGVLALRKAARQLGRGPSVPTEVQQAVKDAQQQIMPMSTNPDPEGKRVLFLYSEAGFVRLQSIGNSYDPKVGATLLTAADTFVRSCTTPTSSTPTPAPS